MMRLYFKLGGGCMCRDAECFGWCFCGAAVRFMWGYARIKWLKVVEKDEKCPGC